MADGKETSIKTIETITPSKRKDAYFSAEIPITPELLASLNKCEEKPDYDNVMTKTLILNSTKFPVDIKIIFNTRFFKQENCSYGMYVQIHKKFFTKYIENSVQLTMERVYKGEVINSVCTNLGQIKINSVSDWGFLALIVGDEINNTTSVRIFLHD
jgi:hypothetical protein